jgi:hypothetical protein
MENLSLQIQKLTSEFSILKKFVDTYETQRTIRIQLKKDYINAYNIYLTKKKEYEDAEIDYKNYLQNNRDNTFQTGPNGRWQGNECANTCLSYGRDFPDFNSMNNYYNLKFVGSSFYSEWSCYCSLPNLEIAKKKLEIKNQKKIESDNALTISMNLKKKFEEALQEL